MNITEIFGVFSSCVAYGDIVWGAVVGGALLAGFAVLWEAVRDRSVPLSRGR